MTVTTVTAALIAWALITSMFLNWYFSSKLANRCDELDQQRLITASNMRHAVAYEARVTECILRRANLKRLPKLNYAKYRLLINLYGSAQMMPYSVPAELLGEVDNPVILWKVQSPSDLSAFELSELWLAGIV